MAKTRKHIIPSMFFLIIMYYFVANSTPLWCQDTTADIQQQFDVALPVAQSSSHNNRMRKPKNKKKKEKKAHTYMDMEYEQLVVAKDIQKTKGNNSATIKYLEQLLKMCTDLALLSEHLVELADVFFIDGQYQKAALVYTQFCALYPGSIQQEYALYRSIVSSFACILSIDRDQTKTEETLELTEVFLRQDHFTTHREEVMQVQTQCHQQLAASDCNICSFYLNKGSLTAAEKRLAKIRSTWLPKLPTLEPEIIALEVQLSELTQKANEHNQLFTQNKKPKHMAERF